MTSACTTFPRVVPPVTGGARTGSLHGATVKPAPPRAGFVQRRFPSLGRGIAQGLCLLLLSTLTPARADLPEVVAAAKPAVFPVGIYDALASPRFGFRGTGFVVGDGRTLVTNMHVLPEDFATRKLALQLGRDRSGGTGNAQPDIRELTVLATDPEHDLVVLSVAGEALPALKLADADAAREGQAVAFLGFPIGGALGFSTVTHRAIVSSITPIVLPQGTARQLNAAAVARLRQGTFEIFQLDGTAYPGNSGGPLLDADTGRVMGIINMVLVKGSRESALSNPTGISYAIPVRWLRELLARR